MSFTPFILDCSIAMTWCFQEESNKYSKFVLNYCNKFGAIVPKLWYLEITNTLLVAEKRSRLDATSIIGFVDLFYSLPINVTNFNFPMHEIINVARSNNLTSYDATYLLTAMHEGLALATNDKALIKACHNNGVPLLKEDANLHFS